MSLKSQASSLKFQVPSSKFQVKNVFQVPSFKTNQTWDLGLGTWDLGLGTWDLLVFFRNFADDRVFAVLVFEDMGNFRLNFGKSFFN
jgi:hypothetical protein